MDLYGFASDANYRYVSRKQILSQIYPKFVSDFWQRSACSRAPSRRGGARGAAPGGHPVPAGIHAVLGHMRAGTPGIREQVLPPEIAARIEVERASTFGWERYVEARGLVIGMQTFGASAALRELHWKNGFAPERIVAAARNLVGRA